MKVYVFAFAAAFVLSLVLGYIALPLLRRLHISQTINSDGPATHSGKQGTPTMGGIGFLLSALLCAAGFSLTLKSADRQLMLFCLLCTLGFALIGFADDYLKVVKRRSVGLTVKQKFIPQCLMALVFAFYAYRLVGKDLLLPFGGTLSLGWFYVPFTAFVLVAMDNSANLLDGLDGLLSSNTAIACVFIAVFCVKLGCESGSLLCVCLCASLMAFLAFNAHPAKVFMGDVGSLGIGAALAAVCIVSKSMLILPFACVTMLISSVSDILQVLYMRRHRGLKLMRMAPLHHHLELGGMPETRVVTVYNLITAAGCLAALLLFM